MRNGIRFSVRPAATRTRIMATIGPKSADRTTLRRMVEEGASFFRFNGAHIDPYASEEGQISYDKAWEVVEHIKDLRNELHQVIGIYFDLGGPKIRVQNVLAVDTREHADSERLWLHPEPGAEVWIRPYTRLDEQRFDDAFASFSGGAGEAKKFWDSNEKVRAFFGKFAPASDRYELMFGPEVTNLNDFRPNGDINLKDGWCRLKIRSIEKNRLHCVVEYRDSTFRFLPHQGANPHLYPFERVITKKDLVDLEVALRMGADIISLSFVCLPSDADALRASIAAARERIAADSKFMERQTATYRTYIDSHFDIPIFAKIETAFAVNYKQALDYAIARDRPRPDPAIADPLLEIADRFDGLMVARGDLAVEVEKYSVPSLQRKIISVARLKNKPVIVATEMLESMKRGNASTRAEIGDINTAVHQQADILMLSGETASPKGRPEAAVREMSLAIRRAEKEEALEEEGEERYRKDTRGTLDALEREREREIRRKYENSPEREALAVSRLSQGAQLCLSARTLQSEAVISSAHTGEAVREIAYYRPRQSIIAITEDVLTAVRLLQHRGVYPVVMEHPISRTVDEFIDIANQIHRDVGIPVPEKDRTKRSFRIPGLLRIEPAVKPVDVPTEIPNSLHEFTLPVKPAPTPEIERKYVLTAATHRRLTACLKRDAMAWQMIRQQNLYFTDSDARLEQARVMVRLRIEKLLDRSDGEADEPRRVLLTIKARAMRRADGFEERDEQEFDVTRDYLGVGEISGLSPTCSRYVADHCGELLQPYRETEVHYRLRGATTNDRLRCTMYNSFVLELDESLFDPAPFGIEHELEIEYRGNDNVRHELDEYVHDKFARLDIAIVNEYPSKLQRAYCYADLLGDRTAPTLDLIRASRERVAAPHAADCERCRKVDEDLAGWTPPPTLEIEKEPEPPPPRAAPPRPPRKPRGEKRRRSK